MNAFRPEILAPAGDIDAMRAAIAAGADAVYFGIHGFNARARAHNFALEDLPAVMRELHTHGVKGFVALNTLVFHDEFDALDQVIVACAQAPVDALIVQDLGVMARVRTIAPTLPLHASTQMTCTDADSVQFAHSVGASRVVLARELSIDDIRRVRETLDARGVDVELEVFVHGALCVSYSGQCLTSEAIGGRSANRGACAQACRLPYELVVDGDVVDLTDRAHLLSPSDLEASALVPELAALRVACLKIEGRLKGPAYVASATRLYRAAVDQLASQPAPLAPLVQDTLTTYSRRSTTGFLSGTNHQALVEATSCDHRGIEVGQVVRIVHEGNKQLLVVSPLSGQALDKGMGVLVQGGVRVKECGGRIWLVLPQTDGTVRLWLGPDVELSPQLVGQRLFKNDDPKVEKRIIDGITQQPHKDALVVSVVGRLGHPLVVSARAQRGAVAQVATDALLEPARTTPLSREAIIDKLGKLGDTPYRLDVLDVDIDKNVTLPISSLNRARQQLSQLLIASALPQPHAVVMATARAIDVQRSAPPPALSVLCRTEAQALAAHAAGADVVLLDFLALTGLKQTVATLREHGCAQIGVAPPRIQKPGEDKIAQFLATQDVSVSLIRNLSTLWAEHAVDTSDKLRVGDFSLNVTNPLSALAILRVVDAFVPSFDLDSQQLLRLMSTPIVHQECATLGSFAEVVLHHPMPLFHMEHCVFAALMSSGADFRTCGRPCEKHTINLRDRAGFSHPVEADIGCRNTVFHARAQSAASLVAKLQQTGVRRFRIELVRESAADVTRLVAGYRSLLAGTQTAKALLTTLKTDDGYGVVKGSLRVLSGDA